MKSYLPRTWADPRLYIAKSKISGKGIFTTDTINPGEIVLISGGEVILRSDYPKVKNRYRVASVFSIDDLHFIAEPKANKGQLVDEYLNHSCDSNCWMADEVAISARRTILPGEEITVDSAMWNDDPSEEYTDEKGCTCGSPRCRKVISATDWQMPELQLRYKDHFSPFLQEKINHLQ